MSQPFFQDDADPTKRLNFDISGIATGAMRTLTAPDQDIDLGIAGLSTAVPAVGDFLAVLDATDGIVKKSDASGFISGQFFSVAMR